MGRRPPKPLDRPSKPRTKLKGKAKLQPGAKRLLRETPTYGQAGRILMNLTRYGHSGAAVLGIAYLDHFLQELLSEHFVALTSEQRQRLFDSGRGGILGAFSAKVLLAYALGFFGPVVLRDLMLMNDIRNAFAHAKQKLSFHSKDIRSDCEKLASLRAYWKTRTESFPYTSPLEIFTETVFVIAAKLLSRRSDLLDKKQRVPALKMANDAFAHGLTDIDPRDRDFLTPKPL